MIFFDRIFDASCRKLGKQMKIKMSDHSGYLFFLVEIKALTGKLEAISRSEAR
jgi:hypothetical protein